MENTEKKDIKTSTKSNEENVKPTPLFEDLKGHKQDDASFEKLMNEQTNRNKNKTKTGI